MDTHELKAELARLIQQMENLRIAIANERNGLKLRIHNLEAELAEATQYIGVLEAQVNAVQPGDERT